MKKLLLSSCLLSAIAITPGISSATVISFSDGVAGYTGTQDTELRQHNPSSNFGTNSNITIDGDDASGPNDDTNALLMFGGIFGSGPSQVMLGATINSATLELQLHSRGNDVTMLRMLTGWDENTATWNSLTNGIQNLPGEAIFSRLLTSSNGLRGSHGSLITVDVSSEVSLWASGTANYGWGFTPTGNDGVDFHTSNHPNDGHTKPRLIIDYTVANTQPIPEPSSLFLVGIGLLGLGFSRKIRS